MNELLSESNKVSSMRVSVMVLLVVALFNITYCTVMDKALPQLSPEWVMMVAAGLGAKVWQKKYETPAKPV